VALSRVAKTSSHDPFEPAVSRREMGGQKTDSSI